MPDPTTSPLPGRFVWRELRTADPDAAARFYAALFDWHLERHAPPTPHLFHHAGRAVAALAHDPAPGAARWLLCVAALDASAVELLHDPTGALIGRCPPTLGAPELSPWQELVSRDAAAALPFYRERFGWEVESVEAPGRIYHRLRAGALDVAGLVQLPPGAPSPSFWLPYFRVDDVKAAARRAARAGAVVHVPPTRLPGVGRFSVLADPQGAGLAVFG